MQENNTNYLEELEKRKIYVDSLKMEMIPYNEAKRLFELLLSETYGKFVEEVNQVFVDYLQTLQQIDKETDI